VSTQPLHRVRALSLIAAAQMGDLSQASAVASMIMPGDADPAATLRNGTFSLNWAGQTIKKFREVKPRHTVNQDLALPTLYLHFLHEDFRVEQGTLLQSLRAGNDMSEVVIKLPHQFLSRDFATHVCSDIKEDVEEVVKALKSHGEVFVSSSEVSSGTADPGTLYFSLKTARPKAAISMDKKAFGIPLDAEQYLFVNNHSSVLYFNEKVKDAFNKCIGELSELGPEAAKFCVFLKLFYEGGFGYNKKIPMGTGFLPVNVGVAAMHVVPAFEGAAGIGTGFPYAFPAPFLPFTETAPISIDAIKSMSEYHGRYGFAFTRVVFVWEGDKWEDSKTLDFCSILPHGGFFYVPSSLRDHQEKGGLVYSFGETAGDAVLETGGYA